MTGLAARAAAIGVLLLVLLVQGGNAIVGAALPAMQEVFERLVPELTPRSFGFDKERADGVVRVVVVRSRYIVLGDKVLEPHAQGQANASTLALQPLYGPLLAVWLTLAWPTGRAGFGAAAGVLGLRLLGVLPAAAALALLDTPIVLAANLWRLLLDHLAPGSFSPLLMASDVLQGGGRYAFGLALGALAVGMAEGLLRRLPRQAAPHGVGSLR